MKVPNDNPESGTYTVHDPLTRISSSGRTFENLFDNVARTRYALGVSSGLDLRKEVEAWVCRDYPGDCTGIDLTKPRKRRLTLSDVINGSRVMMSFVKSGREVVDRAEAERRAQICKTCQFNQIFPKALRGRVRSLAGYCKSHHRQSGYAIRWLTPFLQHLRMPAASCHLATIGHPMSWSARGHGQTVQRRPGVLEAMPAIDNPIRYKLT